MKLRILRKYILMCTVVFIATPISVFAEDEISNEVLYHKKTDNGMVVEYEKQSIELMSALQNISWTIKDGVERRTGSFKLSKGKRVTIKFHLSSNSKVKVGIIDNFEHKTGVKVKSYTNVTIAVPKTSTYRVFVSNQSGKTITVKGTYKY